MAEGDRVRLVVPRPHGVVPDPPGAGTVVEEYRLPATGVVCLVVDWDGQGERHHLREEVELEDRPA